MEYNCLWCGTQGDRDDFYRVPDEDNGGTFYLCDECYEYWQNSGGETLDTTYICEACSGIRGADMCVCLSCW